MLVAKQQFMKLELSSICLPYFNRVDFENAFNKNERDEMLSEVKKMFQNYTLTYGNVIAILQFFTLAAIQFYRK